MSLYFKDEGYSRNSSANKTQVNHHTGTMNDGKLINKGRGPVKGNTGMQAEKVGPPATKDGFRQPPTHVGVTERTYPKNMDSQNYGKQERNPGGTRAWDPKRGQNYNGNADMINIKAKGTNGMGQSQSSNPIAIAKRNGNPDGFNYGPKSQY
jgi:hypothetical protein